MCLLVCVLHLPCSGWLKNWRKNYVFFQVAALLNLFPTQREWGKVGYGSFPLSSKKKKEAGSVLRGMICSSSSHEKSALEMEKYVLSVSLNPAITED